MRALIRADLVETLKREEREIHDTKLTGFTIRCRATGTHVYRLRLGRGQWVTLGRVEDMKPETARAAAMAVLGNVSKKALATVAEGDGAATLVEAKKAARADVRRERKTRYTRTWKGYLDELYEPHVTVHLKRGDAEMVRLRQQFGEFDDLRLQDISPFAIERWKTGRLKAGAAPATVNRDLASLRGALSRAVEWKVLKTHPLADVKAIKVDASGIVRYLTPGEEQSLRDALEARDAKRRQARESANVWRRQRHYDELPAFGTYTDHLTPLTLVALNTGCRRGELFALTWADVEGGRLRVLGETAKSGQTRYIPLNTEARKVLATWKPKDAKLADRVFGGGEAALTTVKTGWGQLMKAAGLADFRFHDLRHTFASKLVVAGVDLNTVRELLGHADLKMTLRYAHLAPEIKAAAVEKLVSGRSNI